MSGDLPEYGHGEGAEGDPGPIVFERTRAADRVDAHEILTFGEVRIVASFPASGREETIWTGGAFLSPYARHSTTETDEDGRVRFYIRRSVGWPPEPCALRVEPIGEGESVCLGGGLPVVVIGDG